MAAEQRHGSRTGQSPHLTHTQQTERAHRERPQSPWPVIQLLQQGHTCSLPNRSMNSGSNIQTWVDGAVLIQITQRRFWRQVSLLSVTSFPRQPFAQPQKDELFPDYHLAILPGSHLACFREDGTGPFEAYIEFIQIVSFSYWLQTLFVVLINIWEKCKTFLVIENQLKLW